MTTLAPNFEQVIATPLPIPDDAPVTRMDLPSKEKGLKTDIILRKQVQINL